jgi:hypothetical protein
MTTETAHHAEERAMKTSKFTEEQVPYALVLVSRRSRHSALVLPAVVFGENVSDRRRTQKTTRRPGRKKMSAAERKAVSLRMKKYWAARRKEKSVASNKA